MKLMAMTMLLAALPLCFGADSEAMKKALEAQKSCDDFVSFDDKNLYLGFGQYKRGFEEPREPIPGMVRVANLKSGVSIDLHSNDAAIDILTENGKAYILTYSGLEEWDLNTFNRAAIYPTHNLNRRALLNKQHAQGMAAHGKHIFIAHGRLGVFVFDTVSKKIVNRIKLAQAQLPLESMAMDIEIAQDKAYVIMDNYSLVDPRRQNPPLRGVVILDVPSQTVLYELDGMDPGATSLNVIDDILVANFGGFPIWKYALDKIGREQLPRPLRRIWQFPVQGHPTGKAFMDDKLFYTCFMKHENNRAFRVPLALKRSELMLD